jgi:tetratricopeptide (TPR) repeat protein
MPMLHMILLMVAALASVAPLGPQARLAEVDREAAVMHLRAGQEALSTERYEEAEREFREAIRLNPRLEFAHYGLGQVFMATKRFDRAVEAFVSCRNLFHENLADNQSQRMAYDRRLEDQVQSMREQLQALQSGRVRSSNPTSSIDRVRNELNQLERLRHRSRGSAGPIPPFILTSLGSAYFRSGAFAEAEREWRAAVEIDPNIGELHNNLAVVFMLTNRFDEAEKEIALAEKAGFKVSPQFKADLKSRRGKT